jgi:hypothetical protein
MLLDWVLSCTFVFSHVYYIFFAKYEHSTDKLMLAIIGPAFTGVFWIYAFFDAARFLPRWYDKILYFISCLLQKPILLPIILPGCVFRSYLALRMKNG